MSNWVVVLLGVIEGITEFLPISSTGHLLLAEHGLHLTARPSELFNVIIQSGAVLAVLFAFSARLRQMWTDRRNPHVIDYFIKLAVAFIVTSAGVLVAKKVGMKLPDQPHPVAWATLVGGIVILVLEWIHRGRPGKELISWEVAIAVGLAQVLAASFPGTSRSGACIMMALAMGVHRTTATEFSFLLGVPTLLAAGAYSTFSALNAPETPHEPIGQLLLGTCVATLTAFVAVRWLLKYVQSHTFVPFGWYRIVMGGVILIAAR